MVYACRGQKTEPEGLGSQLKPTPRLPRCGRDSARSQLLEENYGVVSTGMEAFRRVYGPFAS